MEPNIFRLDITIIRSNLANSPGLPKVDELIAESRVDYDWL